jgi:hypothetical protein
MGNFRRVCMKHKSKCGKCPTWDYRYGERKRWCLVHGCYCSEVGRKCKERAVQEMDGRKEIKTDLALVYLEKHLAYLRERESALLAQLPYQKEKFKAAFERSVEETQREIEECRNAIETLDAVCA